MTQWYDILNNWIYPIAVFFLCCAVLWIGGMGWDWLELKLKKLIETNENNES